jgi:hypothetical protein
MIKHDVRLDLRLPAVQRRELAELATESGLSSADLGLADAVSSPRRRAKSYWTSVWREVFDS